MLWSCTSCGACVQQCPVDIEHVDHIMDMRRYQVMIESSFPSELNGLFKNLENKGNPWGMNASGRNAWIEEVDFEVRVFGAEGEEKLPDDVEWLFWVGCAGAYEDRAKQTTKAIAELLHLAGVEFMVLGEGETCTGDPARRSGNEFLFQMLAQQNVEVLNEIGVTKIVTTCPHCFNTLRPGVPAARRRLRGRPPHPAAQPAGPREAPRRRCPRSRRRSPTTTPATSAGTTRSTRRRASSSSRCPA